MELCCSLHPRKDCSANENERMFEMRIQLELPEATVVRLQNLMKEASVKTYSEIFGYALTGLDWMIKQRRDGRMVVGTDKDFKSVRELSMPILDAVHATPQPTPEIMAERTP
jgi:hypothetical protein